MGLGKLNPGSVARESPCAECDICECQMFFSGCALSWNCVGSTKGRLYKDGAIISDSQRGTIHRPLPGSYILQKLCGQWIDVKQIVVPAGDCNIIYPISCCESIRRAAVAPVGSGFDESSSGTLSGLGGVLSWANGTYAEDAADWPGNPCFGSGQVYYGGAALTELVAQYPGHGTSLIQVYKFAAGWTSAPNYSISPPYVYETQVAGQAQVSVIVRYANGTTTILGTPGVLWGGPIQCSLSGMVYKPVGPLEIKAGLYSPVDIVLMPATIATVSVSA